MRFEELIREKELDRNDIKTQGEANLKTRQRATNRLKDMAQLEEELNTETEEEREQAEEARDNFALCIDHSTELDVQLSTGGDADGFKIYFKEKEAIKGMFYWADWGQYAEQSLTEEEIDFVCEFFNLQGYIEVD